GLPQQRDGRTCYDVEPEEFARLMKQITEMGASVIGGCCGTTPEHILVMKTLCRDARIRPLTEKEHTIVSSYGKSVFLGNSKDMQYGSRVIGERINPTGKKRFKQ